MQFDSWVWLEVQKHFSWKDFYDLCSLCFCSISQLIVDMLSSLINEEVICETLKKVVIYNLFAIAQVLILFTFDHFLSNTTTVYKQP